MSVFSRRILFVILAAMVLGFFTLALLRDTVGREWIKSQVTYYATYAKTADGKHPAAAMLWGEAVAQTALLKPPGSMPAFGIRQRVLDDFRFASGAQRIDRCETCHLAIGESDPALKSRDIPQPFRAHPGDYLETHPTQKFGCTICHAGQGIALKSEPAHGYVTKAGKNGSRELVEAFHHVDTPMLVGQNIEAGCIKCHQGGAMRTRNAHLVRDETPHWTQGKKLFGELGCIGCHSLNGEGGKAAPDLTEVGAKYPDQFDMRHLKGVESVQNWVYEHFKDPQAVVQADPAIDIHFPSDMPNAEQLGMSDDDVRAVTTYVMSLNGEKVFSKYVFPATPEKERTSFASTVEKGRYLFRRLGCIGCHGREGTEADQRKNWNAVGGVIPKLGNLSDRYSRAELSEFILRGSMPPKEKETLESPPLWMPTWRERGLGGQNLEAILDYLFTLKKKRKAGEESF